jgi:hypothetical protein
MPFANRPICGLRICVVAVVVNGLCQRLFQNNSAVFS